MIELIIGVTAPKQIELLQTIKQEPPAVVQVVEPTLQEKIAGNYYKCNTDIQWIRADNAQCLAKPVQTVETTTKAQKPVKSAPRASQGINGYTPGQCTAFVASKRYVPSGWGDASNWGYAAKAEGWTVSSVPVPGAIAWRSGHVAYVESVGVGTVVISEQNYDWNSGIRTIEVPVASYRYIY